MDGEIICVWWVQSQLTQLWKEKGVDDLVIRRLTYVGFDSPLPGSLETLYPLKTFYD